MMRSLLALLIATAAIGLSLDAQSPEDGKGIEQYFRHTIKSFQLDHADADAIVTILNEQFDGLAKFSSSSATNTVYARLPDDAAGEVLRFIDVLEENAAKAAEKAAMRVRQAVADRNAEAVAETMPGQPYLAPGSVVRAEEVEVNLDNFVDLTLQTWVDDTSSNIRKKYEAAEREAAKLADRYRRVKESGKDPKELRGKIQELIAEAFDHRQKMKRDDLARAKAKLDAIQERLDARQKISKQIIKRRLEDLLSGVDLSWLTAADRAENEALAATESVEAARGEFMFKNKQGSKTEKSFLDGLKETEQDVQIQWVPELGTVVIRGTKDDVGKVVDLIETIDEEEEKIHGRVLKLNEEKGTILLNLGTEQGLKPKVPVEVYREGEKIAHVEIVSVAPKDSIARILDTRVDIVVAVGDEVIAVKPEKGEL